MADASTALISLGSNIDPERNLPRAVADLAEHPAVRLLATSPAFEGPAVGGPAPRFLNAAVLLSTTLDPASLKDELLAPIEARLGRLRTSDRFAPRTIDLDLVLYDEQVGVVAGGELPHPDLLVYAHVAVPAAAVAPQRRHPLTGETLASIAARLRPDAQLSLRPDLPLEP